MSFASLLSPQSRVLPNLAVAVGVIPFMLGVSALLDPSSVPAMIKYPEPTDPQARKLTTGITRLFAVRNTAMGLMFMMLWHSGNRVLLGRAMMVETFSAFADGLVLASLTGASMWTRLPVVAVTLGLAASLQGWLDNLITV